MAYSQKPYKRKYKSSYWTKNVFGKDIIWNRKTGGWAYLYDKGMFRGKENVYVISTSLTGGSNPADRQDIGFQTRAEAVKYAENWLEKHK
jgi:hypothetical protein